MDHLDEDVELTIRAFLKAHELFAQFILLHLETQTVAFNDPGWRRGAEISSASSPFEATTPKLLAAKRRDRFNTSLGRSPYALLLSRFGLRLGTPAGLQGPDSI